MCSIWSSLPYHLHTVFKCVKIGLSECSRIGLVSTTFVCRVRVFMNVHSFPDCCLFLLPFPHGLPHFCCCCCCLFVFLISADFLVLLYRIFKQQSSKSSCLKKIITGKEQNLTRSSRGDGHLFHYYRHFITDKKQWVVIRVSYRSQIYCVQPSPWIIAPLLPSDGLQRVRGSWNMLTSRRRSPPISRMWRPDSTGTGPRWWSCSLI